jgi:FkbM family methyltransferase
MLRILKDRVRHLLRHQGYEIYKRPYLPKGVDPYESLRAHWPQWHPQVIFDVGANAGQSVARLRPLFARATIHAFEPVPETFKLLQRATRNDPLTHTHCLALADRDGEAMMTGNDSSDLASLNPSLTETAGSRVPVRLMRLARFCSDQGIPRIDLLKIDVEGFESEVLEGAKPLLESRSIDFIVVEAGLMPGNARFTPLEKLFAILVPQGFWLVGIFEQHGWQRRQAAEFCNAVFALDRHLE